jgi:hypothetical protein
MHQKRSGNQGPLDRAALFEEKRSSGAPEAGNRKNDQERAGRIELRQSERTRSPCIGRTPARSGPLVRRALVLECLLFAFSVSWKLVSEPLARTLYKACQSLLLAVLSLPRSRVFSGARFVSGVGTK